MRSGETPGQRPVGATTSRTHFGHLVDITRKKPGQRTDQAFGVSVRGGT